METQTTTDATVKAARGYGRYYRRIEGDIVPNPAAIRRRLLLDVAEGCAVSVAPALAELYEHERGRCTAFARKLLPLLEHLRNADPGSHGEQVAISIGALVEFALKNGAPVIARAA